MEGGAGSTPPDADIMAQPQQQFLPPQPSHIQRAPDQHGFNLPPHKRQRMAGPGEASSPQPGSPYNGSPYSNMASPSMNHVNLPANAFQPNPSYSTPYASSGSSTLPQSPSGLQNQPQFQQHPPSNFQSHNQNQGNQPANFGNYVMNSQNNINGSGTMGPPSKPADKKEDGIDPMDVLGGTGVDLREEEQYSFSMISAPFNPPGPGSQPSIISSTFNHPPGDKQSFYGAGPANAPAEKVDVSQDTFHQDLANKVWDEASRNISEARKDELRTPFLEIGFMHAKMQKIAREHGLGLMTEKNGQMGLMKLPNQFENRTVKTSSVGGPKEFLASTAGGYVPPDSMLVDQLALLSIAAKHRLQGLLDEAHKLAKGRQTGSHGIIPEDWVEVAAPTATVDSSSVSDGAVRIGWESAVSPDSNPLKRSFSQANKLPTPVSDAGKPPAVVTKVTNEVVAALRQVAMKERDFEEARLKKRLARNNGEVTATPRQGSTIPGTPGSVAPEASEKAPTKKEQKKKAEAKVNEAASHAAANVTTAQFLGGGGGLFGKKVKKYSWMTAPAGGGGGGSGASTPGRVNTQGLPGTAATVQAAPERLTVESGKRMGTWREDRDKGKNIQIRDWITVLEGDGHDKRSLQRAYMSLDTRDAT